MDAAKAAVSKFTSNRGHRTDVDEVVNPAVVSETIKPHKHEEKIEAIDREVHQHHYHTTVQPIAAEERLPEKHIHNLLPTVEKTYRHDNEVETNRRVSAELSQFRNTTITEPVRVTTAALPAVTGEHVHHHVHETVQPVIHKETYQPEVVHTTVPIHETHHVAAQHHGMSALPMKSLAEFTSAGGILSGSQKHTHEEYEGAPRPYNEKLMTTIEKVLPIHHSGTGTGVGATTTAGPHNSNLGNKLDPRVDSDMDGRRGLVGTTGATTGLAGTTGAGYGTTGAGYGTTATGPHGSNLANKVDPRIDSDRDGRRGIETGSSHNRPDSGVGVSGNHSNTSGNHKPSLLDRLNPKVDSDGDGKAGFLK